MHGSPAEGFVINQNYPNPFTRTTEISYTVLREAKVSVKVYDPNGREVRMLVNENQTVGSHAVRFDGTG